MTDPRSTMRDALLSVQNKRGEAVLGRIYDRQPADFEAIVKAACTAYGHLQTGQADGLPGYEPATCGTGFLVAERTLRILERGTPFDAAPSAEAVREIASLAEQAGVAFARLALVRDEAESDSRFNRLDDDVPF